MFVAYVKISLIWQIFYKVVKIIFIAKNVLNVNILKYQYYDGKSKILILEYLNNKSPHTYRCEGDTVPKSNKMFTLAEILQIKQNRESNANSSTISRRY